MPETITRTVSFPSEPIKYFTVKIQPKTCKHILIEHITIRPEEWARRTGIDIRLIKEYMKDMSKDINCHGELCRSVAEMILGSVVWPASFPQYLHTNEEFIPNQSKKRVSSRESFILIAKNGYIIITSRVMEDVLEVITSYFPLEINHYDSDYDAYAKSVKMTIIKYSKKEIIDTKYGLIRRIIQCRFVSDLHWLMVPRYFVYLGERK
jgi:hypothetical protein